MKKKKAKPTWTYEFSSMYPLMFVIEEIVIEQGFLFDLEFQILAGAEK